MNKLRIYLILAILVVGLFPEPARLFGKEYEGCRRYHSAFISVAWKYDTCAWGPWPGTIIVGIPGFLIGFEENSLGKQALPRSTIIFAPKEDGDWLIWGGIRQPYLWRDDHSAIKNLDFRLSPEINIAWCNDYDGLDCYK